MAGETRLEKITHRIAWLERWQRPLAIAVAAAAMSFAFWWFTNWLPPEWPRAHTAAIAFTLAVVVWYGVETVLGYAITLWEIEIAQLDRPAGLPRARLLRRRRR